MVAHASSSTHDASEPETIRVPVAQLIPVRFTSDDSGDQCYEETTEHPNALIAVIPMESTDWRPSAAAGDAAQEEPAPNPTPQAVRSPRAWLMLYAAQVAISAVGVCAAVLVRPLEVLAAASMLLLLLAIGTVAALSMLSCWAAERGRASRVVAEQQGA